MKQEKVFVPVFRNPSYKGKKEIDITGKRFDHLVAIRRTDTYVPPCGMTVPIWLFRCDCGKEVEMNKHMVTSGSAVSCGCMKKVITPNEYYIEDDVMHVITTKGEFIADASDKDFILQHRWFIGKNGYVMSSKKKLLHRMLIPGARLVDHIDRNKLNNCRTNLRSADYSINGVNKRIQSNTGHYGISYTKNGFVVHILGKYAGYYKTLDEAILKRNEHPLFAKVVEIRGATV